MNDTAGNNKDEEPALLPLFELEVDLSKDEEPLTKAEIEENSGVHLRCTVKGDVADEETNLHWYFAGSEIATKDGVQVETDRERLISNLKLDRASHGVYECSVTRKSSAEPRRRKVKVKTKAAALNETLFGEVLCGSDKDGYCQHGGTCLYHPPTKVFSCRCQPGYIGVNCEYFASNVHIIPTGPVVVPPQMNKSAVVVAGLSAFLIVSLIVTFFVYLKKRDHKYRFGRSKFPPAIVTTGDSGEAQLSNPADHHHGSAILERSLSRLDDRIRLIKALLPARCPHCKRTLGINAKLDALSKQASISSRNSTPPMMSYLDATDDHHSHHHRTYDDGSVVRSVSESCFPAAAVEDPRNRSAERGGGQKSSDFLSLARAATEHHRRSFQGKIPEQHHRSHHPRPLPEAISAPVSPMNPFRSLELGARAVGENPNRSKADLRGSDSLSHSESDHISRFVPGVIHEMSVDESGQTPAESIALLNETIDNLASGRTTGPAEEKAH